MGSAESCARRSRTSCSRSASFTPALILSTTAGGVLGGPTMANQAADSKPGSVSAMVGTSGNAVIRFGVATPKSLSCPPFTSASDTPRLSNMRSTLRAAIRHLLEFDAGHQLEQLGGQMRGGAVALGGRGELAGVRLGVGDDVRDAREGQ